jgi:hypothetical protein
MGCQSTFHEYVYRRSEQLSAGTAYHFQTRNLQDLYIFQSAPADPVMYIVDQNLDIVARNDDYTGLASEIFYTPSVTGQYTLIIRAFNTKRPGYCDLYRGVSGAPPVLVEAHVKFFGVLHFAQWNQGDEFETANSSGDPYLFLISGPDATGSKMYFGPTIDDAGFGLNSKFVAPTAGSGLVILGSYSRDLQGHCDLCQSPTAGPIFLTPDFSSNVRPLEQRDASGSREMQRFTRELKETKEFLEAEAMESAERDRRVADLQQQILSDDERRSPVPLPPQATPDSVRLLENYLERYKELEPELEGLSYTDRSQKLTELKRRMVGGPSA